MFKTKLSKKLKLTLLQHKRMNNDRHSQQMDNDKQAPHNRMLKARLLIQLLGMQKQERVPFALLQLFQQEYRLQLQLLIQHLIQLSVSSTKSVDNWTWILTRTLFRSKQTHNKKPLATSGVELIIWSHKLQAVL